MAVPSAPFEQPPSEAEFVDRPAVDVLTLCLDHDFAKVGVARRSVEGWLDERGCCSVDDAVLVLSELVTNAMVHAGAGCTIEVQHSNSRVRLEVRDGSPRAPIVVAVPPCDVGGRGLHLVDVITEAWGWEHTADGKRVWAIINAPVHLPGRDDRRESPSS